MEKKNFITPDHLKNAVKAVRGEGIYIYDEEGKAYIDGSSGPMTANLGHGNKEIKESIKEQMDKISFTYRSQFVTEPLLALCEGIAKAAGGDLNKVSLCNSGSEATELALKMVRSYFKAMGKPEKGKIISRWASYHGATIETLSLSGHSERRRDYSPYLTGTPQLEIPHCFRCSYEKKYPECGIFCARYFEKLVKREGPENIGAIIIEPVSGAAAASVVPPFEYFKIIREICDKYNILLISDEVITGFGRTGEYFAFQSFSFSPDIVTFGKGISSGFGPLAGIIVKEKLYEEMTEKGVEFGTGHTYGGNPLSAEAGVSVLQYMEKHDTVKQVKEKGEKLFSMVKALEKSLEVICEVRGKSLLLGVEFAEPGPLSEPFSKEINFTKRVVDKCMENGLIVYPSRGFIDGVLGDSVIISPPFIISDEEMEKLVSIFEKSVREAYKDILKLG